MKARKKLLFDDLMKRLAELAGSLEKNRHGAIEVRVFGLDASPLDRLSHEP